MKTIVFGATGAIGEAICAWHVERGHDVVAVSRSRSAPAQAVHAQSWIEWTLDQGNSAFASIPVRSCTGAVWAQGMNFNDNVRTFDAARHVEMYTANVVYILESLKGLLNHGVFAKGAGLCVISSIWQDIARQNKLSYGVTKSALEGLVRSLAIDLGADGYKVNAILPGPLDTPMTRANLSAEQISQLEHMAPLGSLPALDDVCRLVGFLCSPENVGITGQFIAADRGFSHARFL